MAQPPIVKIPRGIADPTTGRLYVVAQEGAIHCLDLQTGNLLARTHDAATPLTATAEILIGWRLAMDGPNDVMLIALRLHNGTFDQRWATPLPLPSWATIPTEEIGGFTVDATIADGQVQLTWEAQARYQGGAPPPAHIEAAALQSERRQMTLDLATGAILADHPTSTPTKSPPPVPTLPTRQQIVPYRQGDGWATEPWPVDAGYALLATTADGSGIDLVRTDDDTNELERTTLIKERTAIVLLTPDRRYLLLHRSNGQNAPWRLVNAATGKTVADLALGEKSAGDITEAAVIDELLLYLVSEVTNGIGLETLGCVLLSTAEPQWSYPLTAVARRGPPPLRP